MLRRNALQLIGGAGASLGLSGHASFESKRDLPIVIDVKTETENRLANWLLYRFIEGSGNVKFGNYDPNWCGLQVEPREFSGYDIFFEDTSEARVSRKAGDLIESIVEGMMHASYQDASSDDLLIGGLATLFPSATVHGDYILACSPEGSAYGGRVLSDFGRDLPDFAPKKWFNFAPKMFNCNGYWRYGIANNWQANASDIMRLASESIAGGSSDAPILHIMALDMYMSWMVGLSSKARKALTIDDYSKSLGFTGVMNFEGAAVAWDYACPRGVGYAINPNFVQIAVDGDDFFTLQNPRWDKEKSRYEMHGGFKGNFRWHPQYVVQYASYPVR